MEPTIFSEDIILTEHITPRFNRIHRGDVIIARSPSNPRHHICKRVVALEGDKVKNGFHTHIVSNGVITVDLCLCGICYIVSCVLYCISNVNMPAILPKLLVQ